jgi:hypothetical protein
VRDGLLTGPGDKPFGSFGFSIDCPIVIRLDSEATLERLVAHPVVKSSKRCPVFLRYVVERAHDGPPGGLV